MLQIKIKQQAEGELWEIGNWYRSESKGLDFKFLNAFESEIKIMQKSPSIFPVGKGKI